MDIGVEYRGATGPAAPLGLEFAPLGLGFAPLGKSGITLNFNFPISFFMKIVEILQIFGLRPAIISFSTYSLHYESRENRKNS